MLEIAIELGDEGRIVAQRAIGRAQFRQRRHQRLRDVAAAVGAEVSVGVGIRVVVVDFHVHVHRLAVIVQASLAASAARTASTKRRIFAASLMPGADSMPLETSTA